MLLPTESLPHVLGASQTVGVSNIGPPLNFFSSQLDTAHDRQFSFPETRDEWLGLIDNLIRDVQAATMHKPVLGRISKHLHQIRELISAPGWHYDGFVHMTRMLRRVNESLIGILRMGTFKLYIHRSSVQQTLEETVLLLDDTITSIQYGGEIKQLDRLADDIDIKNAGRILVQHINPNEPPSFPQLESGERDFQPTFPTSSTTSSISWPSFHDSDDGYADALDTGSVSMPAPDSFSLKQFTACGPCQLRQVKCDLKYQLVKDGEKITCTSCSERGITCVSAYPQNREPRASGRARPIFVLAAGCTRYFSPSRAPATHFLPPTYDSLLNRIPNNSALDRSPTSSRSPLRAVHSNGDRVEAESVEPSPSSPGGSVASVYDLEPSEASSSSFSGVISSNLPTPRSASVDQSHSPARSRFLSQPWSRSRSRSRSRPRFRSRSPPDPLDLRAVRSHRSNSPQYIYRWSEAVSSENSPSERIPSRRRRRESSSVASVRTSSRSRLRSPGHVIFDRRPRSIGLGRTHTSPPSDGSRVMDWQPASRSRSPIMPHGRYNSSVNAEITRTSLPNDGSGPKVLGGPSGYQSRQARQMWDESPNPMANRPRAVSRSRSRSPPRPRMIVDSGSYASSKNSIPDLERLRRRPGQQTVGDDLPLPDIHHSPSPDIRSWHLPHESLPSLAPEPDIASGSSSANLPESHVQARRRRALGDGSIRLRDSGSIISGLVSVADIGGVPLPSGSALNVASGGKLSAPRGVTHYTIEELCEEIRAVPELGNMPIGDLYRREIPSGVQHEFILIKSVEQQGRTSTWIRIDRAAKGYRDRFRLTSRYPADDTARMGANENHKLMAGESRLRAHVEFNKTPKQPRFLTLADLLTIMHQESSDYRLLSENCYFFTSVLQEILTEFHEGELVSGSLGHKTLGRKVRQNIRNRFASSLTPSRVLDRPTVTARTVRSVPLMAIAEKPTSQRSRTLFRRLASMVCS